jgi:Fe-S-cluster containining protein
MASSSDVPACLSCGACCFSRLDRYVRVMGCDHARLGYDAEQLTVFIDNRCYMRMQAEHCAALLIEPTGRFVCSVYDRRPDVCRGLERAGAACDAERSLKRGRTHLALYRAVVDSPAGPAIPPSFEQPR